MSSSLTNPQLQSLHRTMCRIRAFEDAAEQASRGGVAAFGQAAASEVPVRGPLHLSTGQEAVAAGVCAHLRPADYLTSTHRGHGHTIAKGANVGKMMHELFGKASGFCGGRGGSMHIADFSVGMLGANGVVAANITIAAGAAHAIRLTGADRIVCCLFGDGAINRGPFLEGLNWAKVFGLPVVFVCEDNGYAATTRSGTMTAGPGAAARAESLGIEAETVDGNDVEAVDTAASALVTRVRAGEGPLFLHARTYRHTGHTSVDPGHYRPADEVTRRIAEDDPIARLAASLELAGVQAADLAADREAAKSAMREVAAFARAQPYPDAAGAFEDVQDVGSPRDHPF